MPRLHTLPTRYDGPDLADVAATLRLPAAEVVRRHAAAIWTVAAIGFSPGFGYLTTTDPLFAAVGRRAHPRPRVPRGSVALAAQMCAIYPSATPGGWQLIGSTTAELFDVAAEHPALLRVGDRVEFVEVPLMAGLRVVGLSGSALFQDAGRHHVDSGVPVSGAFDRDAHAAATALVGGTIEQASLEVVGRIEVVPDLPITCAVTGRATVTVDGRPAARWTALDVPAGARVEVHAEGRAYLAWPGGSSPRRCSGRDPPACSDRSDRRRWGSATCCPWRRPARRGPRGTSSGLRTERSGVRVIPGPHLRIGTCDVRVLESSRIGVRLTAGRLEGAATQVRSDLPSLGVLPGAVQVLPSGDWMLLGPDAGTMGGYPIAGVVATADLGAWAHVRVGEVVHLEVIDAGDAPDPAAPAVVRVQGLGG